MNVNRDFYGTFIGQKAEITFTFQRNEFSKRFQDFYRPIFVVPFIPQNTYTIRGKQTLNPRLEKYFSALVNRA